MKSSFIQRFGTYFTLFFIAVLAVATGFYFYNHTFRGLSPQALDSAQLARNIFRGAGFSSNLLPLPTPGSQILGGATGARIFNPELGQGPLFPVLLGATFAFADERDGVVAGLTLALFVATTLALFCLTGRLTRSTPLATAAAIVFVSSRVVLGLGVSGQPQALSSLFLLLTLLALTPKTDSAAAEIEDSETLGEAAPDADSFEDDAQDPNRSAGLFEAPVGAPDPKNLSVKSQGRDLRAEMLREMDEAEAVAQSEAQADAMAAEAAPDEPPAAPKRAPGYFLAGVLAALCYLSDPLALVPLLFLVPGWGRGWAGWKRPAVVAFALGALILALPWWVRNARLTGNPFFSTQWLGAGAAPGFSGLVVNMVSNGRELLFGAANVPNFFLAPFIVVSPWMRPLSAPLSRLRSVTLWGLLLTIAVLGALGHRDVSVILPFAPLLALLGIVTFRQIVGDAFSRRMQNQAPGAENAGLSFGARVWLLILTVCGLRQAKTEFLARRTFQASVEAATGEAALDSGRVPRQRASLAASLLVLLLLLATPLIALPTLPLRPDARAALAPLGKIVAPNGTILTDAPQGIAWYGDRNVMALPDDVNLWFETPQNRINAIYLLGQNGGLSTAFPPAWRDRLTRNLDLPGYRRITTNTASNLIYLREPTPDEARLAVKNKPQNGAALVALGNALLQKGDFAGALPVFQSAIRVLPPQSGEGFYGAGVAYLGQKKPATARIQFEQALKRDPRSVAALLQLAGLEQVKTDKSAAIALYERVLADVPNSAVALNNLANFYADDGKNLFRALEMARRAATQNPQNGSIIDTLGWVCFRLGYKEEALTYLRRAAELEPQNQNIAAHLQRALADSENSTSGAAARQ